MKMPIRVLAERHSPRSSSSSTSAICVQHTRIRAIIPGHHPRHRRRSARAGVQGASVLIIDDATGVPRTLETDAEGRYEASNLRPGTYRVQVVTTNFKKFERTGVLVGAAGTALVDVTLELGGINETVTVAGESRNNITLESQAIVRGLDEQQLHDLPRNSRDIQSFLLLNPNVVGGADDIQFLGAKTYGVSYIQDGQASTNAIFGTIGNSAPGLDAISEIHGAVELLQRRVRRPGGRRGDDQARLQQLPRDQLLRLQQRQPERADLQPDALGRRARRSPCPTRTSTGGAEASAGPSPADKLFFYAQLRRLEQQGDLRWWAGDRSDRSDAQRRLPRHRDRAARPARPGSPSPIG